MAAPTIPNGEEQFFTTLYEGNGAAQRVGKFVPFTDNATIANSCMFNSADSADKLQATIGASSTANTRRKMTISLWYKFTGTGASYQTLWTVGGDGQVPYIAAYINNNGSRPKGSITFFDYTGSGSSYNSLIETKRGFSDTSKWYHVLFAMDTTQSTDSDRFKIYVDGDLQETDTNNYYSQDFDTGFGTNVAYAYGTNKTVSSGSYWFDGYLAEINHVDGTALTPSTFGLTDTSTGRWIPKTLTGITYGDNGHRLKFQDSSALGDDTSGNGNDFTATDLASANQTTDSPTQNFPIVNILGPYIGSQQATQEGGLKIVMTAGSGYPTVRVHKEIPQSGKWYWEVKAEQVGNIGGIQNAPYGVLDLNLIDANQLTVGNPFTRHIGGMGLEMYSGAIFTGLLTSAGKSATDFTIGSTSMGDNDYIVFAFDMDNGKAWWGWNDSSAGSSVVWFANDGGTDGNPSTGANPTVTFNPSDHRFVPAQGGFAPGSSDGAGSTYASNFIYNFGSKSFAFTAPTGFSSLSQNNFPETDKGISGLTWTKDRDAVVSWMCIDSSRIYSAENVPGAMNLNNTNREYGQVDFADGINKFLKGGYALVTKDNSNSYMNKSGNSNVSYSWVANNGTTATNETGSITSTVQANTTAGFSIVQYVGTGSSGSVGHGLSAAPEFMIFKDRDNDSTNWRTFHTGFGNITTYQKLNSDDGYGSASMWGTPTASAFIIGGTGYEVNESSTNYVAYCWHGVDGFSKFGRYTGNNSSDGTFVYLGFRPALVIVKGYTIGSSWVVMDSKRDPFNSGAELYLQTNSTAAEAGSIAFDFLSNGFKCRDNATGLNGSYDYLYMAWAEHPFVGDGTNPVTAR